MDLSLSIIPALNHGIKLRGFRGQSEQGNECGDDFGACFRVDHVETEERIREAGEVFAFEDEDAFDDFFEKIVRDLTELGVILMVFVENLNDVLADFL